ncbi:NtaA/DmoA family FMN-dependent monooxygenase [Paenibacillus sp. strain BS8-2]
MRISEKRQLKLAALPVSPAHLGGGWRYPGADADHVMNLSFYRKVAQQAERGKLDMLFLADKYILSSHTDDPEFEKNIHTWPEPVTLLSALIGTTEHIGLSATLSTTYHEPFHVARTIASMDHLSDGRASWNVVTSRGDAEDINFGPSNRIPQEQRHEQSTEFLDIVRALWDSWEDDALQKDRSGGLYVHRSKIHPVPFKGRWHQVQGPLNVSRPPQGHPVIVMAGESDTFKSRAAKDADVVFTSLNNLTIAQSFYKDIKSQLALFGRKPDDLVVMPGLNLVIGRTAAEVKEKEALWQEAFGTMNRMDYISAVLGVDLLEYSPDDALPDEENFVVAAGERYKLLLEDARRNGLITIRQAFEAANSKRGHLTLKGTPSDIADVLEQWLTERAADGFIFIPQHMPGSLDDLVELLIPELQTRGLFRTEYTGRTLRDHLGLSRPGGM